MHRRKRDSEQLWTCPECGRGFANRNQSHFCGRFDLEHHFEGKAPEVRALFDALVELFSTFGPVTILPEKTRIAFQVRMSFAAVSVRRTYLIGHLVLARRVESLIFPRIETISLRNHVHHFRLAVSADLNETFRTFAREAYEVGEQRHLERNSRKHKRRRGSTAENCEQENQDQ
jgi:hypothetical protein